MTQSASGLSPRVRGNPEITRGYQPAEWSIPACAGEPLAVSPSGGPDRVYPRVCGGTPEQQRAVPVAGGLSPRVRGNPIFPGLGPPQAGSIPACAGEPGYAAAVGLNVRVYPRVCGGTIIRR